MTMTKRSNLAAHKPPAKGNKYFPPGWDQERVQKLIKHYDSLTEDEWIAEDEAAYTDPENSMMSVPNELVPAITQLILAYEKAKARNGRKLDTKKAKAKRV